MLRSCSPEVTNLVAARATGIASYLASQLAAEGEPAGVNPALIEQWLTRTSHGPFDGAFARWLADLTHVGGGVTFPGVDIPLPPQLVVACMAWVQGQVLEALAEVTDAITLSGLGGIWMDLLLLQLGLILEPALCPVSTLSDPGQSHALHPYARLAGFGPSEGRIIEETGRSLAPLADGVAALAYSHLVRRPESAGYFRDAEHLARRKETLKGWWVRTASDPYDDAGFGQYLRKVAHAHARHAGEHPDVEVPAQLTIALMGWVEMRVMAALNTFTMAQEVATPHPFQLFGGDPSVLAALGRAWMAMLTLQLGVLLEPHLALVR